MNRFIKADILSINEKTPIESIQDTFLTENKISLFVKREDLNHPHMSGNKWYKLKHNIEEAKKLGHHSLLTFGGAYSNHIYAVATAGKIFNFKTIGIIRGEEHHPLNPTLSFAKAHGMEIHYLNRTLYRNKNSTELIDYLKQKFGKFYLLPEGGTNRLAIRGCSEIIDNINVEFDYICCPCGTGGTLTGLIDGLNGKSFALGFAVLKGANFLRENVNSLLKSVNKASLSNWDINLDYHFGGYAKLNNQLLEFSEKFSSTTKIPIEPIYTGKMFFGIYDLVQRGYFKKCSKIIAIHTGGLQGLRGLASKIKSIKT